MDFMVKAAGPRVFQPSGRNVRKIREREIQGDVRIMSWGQSQFYRQQDDTGEDADGAVHGLSYGTENQQCVHCMS